MMTILDMIWQIEMFIPKSFSYTSSVFYTVFCSSYIQFLTCNSFFVIFISYVYKTYNIIINNIIIIIFIIITWIVYTFYFTTRKKTLLFLVLALVIIVQHPDM